MMERRGLPAHRFGSADEMRWTCSTCGVIEPHRWGDRYVRRSCACEQAAESQRKEEMAEQARRNARLAHTFNWLSEGYGGAGLKDKTFESFCRELEPRALKACEKFAEHPEGTFCLIGSVGCGKTHLAAAICHSLHSKPYSYVNAGIDRPSLCLYADWPRLIIRLKQNLTEENDYMPLVHKAATTEVLVLDDLDRGKAGVDFDHQIARMIIGDREQAGLPTVVICHHKINELVPFIGEDAVSRLYFKLTIVTMSSKDFRQRREKL